MGKKIGKKEKTQVQLEVAIPEDQTQRSEYNAGFNIEFQAQPLQPLPSFYQALQLFGPKRIGQMSNPASRCCWPGQMRMSPQYPWSCLRNAISNILDRSSPYHRLVGGEEHRCPGCWGGPCSWICLPAALFARTSAHRTFRTRRRDSCLLAHSAKPVPSNGN